MPLITHDLEAECLVIGGGPAGYGAAVAALREGCPTLLVDRHGFLGGMGTAAGLTSYLNHNYKGEELAGSAYIDLIEALSREKALYHDAHAQADFFDPEACKRIMEERVLALKGDILYHCMLESVRREGERWQVGLLAKGARLKVCCRYLIDATGDGDACALAGAAMTHGRRSDGRTQPMSMVVQVGGFDPEAWVRSGGDLIDGRFAVGGDCFAREVVWAKADGAWSIPRENIALWWAMPGDPTRVTINGTRVLGFAACNPIEHSAAEIEGRRQAKVLADFFRHYIPGFGRSFLLATGPQIGVRESRRIIGQATLTEADIWGSIVPDDSVVRCAYPIDIHQPDGETTHFEDSQARRMYGISFGCLLPKGLTNIAAAGRCISATHEAAGSFRVMPTCMSLGEAAGVATGLARRKNTTLDNISGVEISEAMRGFRKWATLAEFDSKK